MNLKIYIFISLNLFLNFTAFSVQRSFDHFERLKGFDYMFMLVKEDHDYFGILDCQSYFNKLELYDEKSEIEEDQVIYRYECEYLFRKIDRCLLNKKRVCLDTDDLWLESCECNFGGKL